MPMAITIGYGSAPMVCAMEMAMGARSAAAAVLDMNWVSPHERMNIAVMMSIGEGASPMSPTTTFAMSCPAPLLSMALASGSIPAKRKIVVQSMPRYACFSVRQPVRTQASAPMMAMVSMSTPMLFSSTMARTTAMRMTAQMTILRGSLFSASDSSEALSGAR